MNHNTYYFLLAIWILLTLATLIVHFLAKKNQTHDYSELLARTKSWWLMLGIFTFALIVNLTISIIFLAFISFLALKEFLSIVPTRRADRRILFWAYLSIPIQYLFAAMAWYGMFIIFIPVYMFLFIPFRLVLRQETEGFLKSIGIIQWALMITVFALSHSALLLTLPNRYMNLMTGAGLLIYLFFLTEMNDVAQFVSGKLFGKHKIIPKISPNKTWQGFIGGLITTMLLSVISAHFLTVFSWEIAVILGFIIGVVGFIGDVTISAIKRDIGIKDTGNLIKGHGGILDRVDSLTFTAPIFFHFVYYFYF